MSMDERRLQELRKGLSECIGLADSLGTVENLRAVQHLVAFLYAAQDTLEQILPQLGISHAAAVTGTVVPDPA